MKTPMGQRAHCEDCNESVTHETGSVWVHNDGSSVRMPICDDCGYTPRRDVEAEEYCSCSELDLDLYENASGLDFTDTDYADTGESLWL